MKLSSPPLAQTSIFDDKGNAYQLPKDFLAFSASASRVVDPDTKEEAITRVKANANPEWMSAATKVAYGICKGKQEFTTDDLWAVIDTLAVSTKDNRAMGAVMTNAESKKWCQMKDCRPIPSKRPQCHGRPVCVWESLLFSK
jgi:hypothetical protein